MKKNWLQWIQYLLFFLLFCIAFSARIDTGIAPFSQALFFALIVYKANPFALSVVFFLAGSAIDGGSVENLVSLALFAIVFIVCKYSLKKLHWLKVLPFFALAQSAFIYFGYTQGLEQFLQNLISLIVGLIFFVLFYIFIKALQTRKFKTPFTIDEKLGGASILAIISLGLFNTEVLGVSLLCAIVGFLFLFCSACFGNSTTLFVALSVGIGAAFGTLNLSVVGVFMLIATACVCFKNQNRIYSIIAMILSFAVAGFYFNAMPNFSVVDIAMLTLGCGVFIAIPKKTINFFAGLAGGLPSSLVTKSAINRNREGVCKRLTELSGVFSEMERVYRTMIKGALAISEGKMLVAQNINEKVCDSCPDKHKCHRGESNGNELFECFCQLAAVGSEKDKVTFLDVPPYLVSRCSRLNTVLAAVNQQVVEYKQYNNQIASLDAGKVLMGNQLSGISRLMLEVAEELKQNVYFDSSKEEEIKEELNARNILASDCILYRADIHRMFCSLLVKESDSSNPEIEKVISKVCKHKMILESTESANFEGHSIINLASSPKYNAVFGVAKTNKVGSLASGDSYSVLKLGRSKYMIAICDGMGSGERAERASNIAITLVENFYKAGFSSSIILSSVNGLLTLTQEDVFTALDICVIDLDTSATDFIKVGAPYGFIKRHDSVELVQAGALPLGVLDEMQPKITKTMVSNKDVIFLCSDGITDAFKTQESLGAFVNSLNALNPQTAADELLAEAIKRNGGFAGDDMTVLVARIYQRV